MNLSAMNWDIKLQEIKSISLSPYTCLPLALMDETFFFYLHKICSKSQQVVLKSVGHSDSMLRKLFAHRPRWRGCEHDFLLVSFL